jgi:uncharacterized membrane protein YfcA
LLQGPVYPPAGSAGAVLGGRFGRVLPRRMSPNTSKILIAILQPALGVWFLLHA